LYMAPMDGRVGFFSGTEADAAKYFSGKVQKPLANRPLVAEALKTLPAKRNLVILVDAVGFLPMIGPMMGMEIPANLPPGPPAAISTTLSGDYARTDIHVPAKAISRVMEIVSPPPPT